VDCHARAWAERAAMLTKMEEARISRDLCLWFGLVRFGGLVVGGFEKVSKVCYGSGRRREKREIDTVELRKRTS